MILYSCASCDFGIAGSHPETAEDEYELRQDIDAHEEMHRELETEAASDPLQRLADQGLVVLPQPKQKPLTHDDVRAIVREEIRRVWLPDLPAPIVGGSTVDSRFAVALEEPDPVLRLHEPTLKTHDGQHQGGDQTHCAERLATCLLNVLNEFIPDGGRDGELVWDRQSLQVPDAAQEVSPSVVGRSSTVGDRSVGTTASAADCDDSGSALEVLTRRESLVEFVEPLGHGADHLGGSGGSRVIRREGMEGLVDRLHSGERVRDRVDSASEVIKSSVGCHSVPPPSVDSGVTTLGEGGGNG
ncbi:hypothetical protein [Rhodococcus sp. JVH1]|uniref:hypothetical protein n=1 Tax=Rhodococcus sp. JVH1 TaxID=745408 RepID=UPI0012F6BD97|nr:hypothetical protein [Rhodococcus sp. JVH1]